MANERPPLRVFLDANILIRGITFPRFPYEVLRHAASQDFTTVLSSLVIGSVRHYVQKLYPDQIDAWETLLALLDFELAPEPTLEAIGHHARLVRDSKDVPVALAAIQSEVDYLISTDQDFIVEDASTAELRQHLRPVGPGWFLRHVMGRSSEELTIIEGRRWSDLERVFWK